MSGKFQDRYRIPSTRLQNWDYGWNSIYFITICTKDHEHCFGKIIDKTIELSAIGLLVHQFWCEIPDHFPFISLDAFVIMPNHIHGILIIDKENDGRYEMGTESDLDLDSDSHSDIVEKRHCLFSTTPPGLFNTPPTPPPSTIKTPIKSPGISNTNAKSSNIPADITIGHNRFQNQGSNNISSIIGSYKSIVSRNVHLIYKGFSWQTGFYDHIVHSDREFDRISQYIDNNPENWAKDKYFT